MEIFNHNSNVNFLGMRKYSIAIAAFLMIASIGVIATKGLNYGLDFNGGVSVVVDYDQPVQIATCALRWPKAASIVRSCRVWAVRVKYPFVCSPRMTPARLTRLARSILTACPPTSARCCR